MNDNDLWHLTRRLKSLQHEMLQPETGHHKEYDGNVGPGEAWYSDVQVSSNFLQVSSKRGIFIRLCELVPCIRHPIE